MSQTPSRKVHIGIPMHQGVVTAQTMASVSTATSVRHAMNYQSLGLSLLAKNFNLLFISAVKRGYDYFLLHHSDLGVAGLLDGGFRGSWLDLLIDRLEKHQLKALSVAVPIKNQAGVFSSGILTVPGDAWSLRRHTVKELNRMPTEIITRDDMAKTLDVKAPGAMLVNSGLLLMDIRDRGGIWREKEWPGFNIADEIVWNRSGVPESYTVPEDWGLSIWCHENNVPYALTREIIVAHVGGTVFLNNGDWGDETDVPRQQISPEEYRLSR